MLTLLARLPFFIQLCVLCALFMFVPAAWALGADNHTISRTFFYAGLLTGVFSLLIGLALLDREPGKSNHLVTLVAAYLVLPAVLAVPFYEAHGNTTFFNTWFEMVSAFTTTGATLYDSSVNLDDTLHLWRALVGWLGGLFIWITAIAVLAPLNLGGFEVNHAIQGATTSSQGITDTHARIATYTRRLVPIYSGLTALLFVLLLIADETPFVALCHAMSTLSTSGISPIGGLYDSNASVVSEIFIFLFMFFAISRRTFSKDSATNESVWKNSEIRVAAVLLLVLPAMLFLRHFLDQSETISGFVQGARSMWGAMFTVMSFLSTTGFESREWELVSAWSDLSAPGFILIGLALMGGGIATTAGGIKIMRVYALFRHSERELEKIVHPSSVGGAGIKARRIRRDVAEISWVFFMMFIISFVLILAALSLTGVQFENATLLTIAALSNTGPLVDIASDSPIAISGITEGAKFILALTMVLGRLETLAVIVMLHPEFRRK